MTWFNNAHEAMEYLKLTTEHPFVIFCDVNLPGQNGIEFKKNLDADPYLRKKSIPFIFYSTSADARSVNEAYTKMTIQGFFQKKDDYNDIKNDIRIILDYWKVCKHPNSG